MYGRNTKKTCLWLIFFCLFYNAAMESRCQTADKRTDHDRTVNITALQAGSNHYSKGNPGTEANFRQFEDLARKAAVSSPKPDIICFPEYTITGWSYPPENVMNGIAEEVPGNGTWYKRYVSLARETGIPLLAWIVEKDGNKLYNTSFIIDGNGVYRGKYRKVQANLGEQTWWGWSQGEHFSLIELDGIKYGISICADMWYPETVRCEELLGADVILHVSIADDMSHLIPARAFDSKMPIVATIFQGGSYAVDREGNLLGKLAPENPSFITFSIQPFKPHLGNKYGGIWDTRKGGHNVRNTDAYSILTDPSTRPPWTEIFMDQKGNPQTREQLLERFRGRYDYNDGTRLGIKGDNFTVNGKPEFLYGMSYYGALGASHDLVKQDIADLKRFGFNWIRVWANWYSYKKDVSSIDGEGRPREPFFSKLKWLVEECSRNGIVVDVTLTRGKDERGNILFSQESHSRAVQSITELLKHYNNWYLDLANERDVRDNRFVSFDELKILAEQARRIKPGLLITASSGNDISQDDVRKYIDYAGVDFICPHRPRNSASPLQTRSKTIEYLTWIKETGKTVPVHYQEPFRRGYSNWEPLANDFINDLVYSIAGGAAGWCLHNGSQKGQPDEQPRRSFDMSAKRLFDQLDDEEMQAVISISRILKK